MNYKYISYVQCYVIGLIRNFVPRIRISIFKIGRNRNPDLTKLNHNHHDLNPSFLGLNNLLYVKN